MIFILINGRFVYQVQQFIRPSAENEETVDKKEFHSEKESSEGQLKCRKYQELNT